MRRLLPLLACLAAGAVQATPMLVSNGSGTTQITNFNSGGAPIDGVVLVLLGTEDGVISGTIAPVYDPGGANIAFEEIEVVVEGAGEMGEARLYFIGSGLPSTQNVTINFGGGSAAIGHAFGYVGDGAEMELQDVGTININGTMSPSVGLQLNGVVSAVGIGFMSGHAQTTGTSPLSNWTDFGETVVGSTLVGRYIYNIVGSSDVTAGWTQVNNEDAVAVAWAISEVVGPAIVPQAAAIHLRRMKQ